MEVGVCEGEIIEWSWAAVVFDKLLSIDMEMSIYIGSWEHNLEGLWDIRVTIVVDFTMELCAFCDCSDGDILDLSSSSISSSIFISIFSVVPIQVTIAVLVEYIDSKIIANSTISAWAVHV